MPCVSDETARLRKRLARLRASRREQEWPSGSGIKIGAFPVSYGHAPDLLEEIPLLILAVHDVLVSLEPRTKGSIIVLRELVSRRWGLPLSDLPPRLTIAGDRQMDAVMTAIEKTLDGLSLLLANAESYETTSSVPPPSGARTITVAEAAMLLGRTKKTLQDLVSEAKRAGREFDWVLRAGRQKGFVVHSERYLKWLESKPVRRGRPPKRPLTDIQSYPP